MIGLQGAESLTRGFRRKETAFATWSSRTAADAAAAAGKAGFGSAMSAVPQALLSPWAGGVGVPGGERKKSSNPKCGLGVLPARDARSHPHRLSGGNGRVGGSL